MSDVCPVSHDRSQFMADEGYGIYSDYGHQLVDNLAELPVLQHTSEANDDYSLRLYDNDPGAYGTYIVSQSLIKRADTVGEQSRYPELVSGADPLEDNQVLESEWSRMDKHAKFQHGLGNADFSMHFIPLLAVDCLRAAASDMELSQEERRTFTLHDYASVMRTDWFKALLHDLSGTSSGSWNRMGTHPDHYKSGIPFDSEASYIAARLGYLPDSEPFYEVSTEVREDEAEVLIREVSVSLSTVAQQGLAATIRGEDSVGCPVGYKKRPVDPTNPHIRRLVNAGYMTVTERPSGRQIGEQYTPIEHAADMLADYFDRYADAFGQPVPATHLDGSMLGR